MVVEWMYPYANQLLYVLNSKTFGLHVALSFVVRVRRQAKHAVRFVTAAVAAAGLVGAWLCSREEAVAATQALVVVVVAVLGALHTAAG